MKKIMTSRWFVNFMGSHLSTEEEAARALGGLLMDAKYSNVSGRYFDGFKEIPSSAESREEAKASAVWEQTAQILGLSREDADYFPPRCDAQQAPSADPHHELEQVPPVGEASP